LKGVARADVLLGALDRGQIILLRDAMLDFELRRFAGFFADPFGGFRDPEGLREALLQPVEALDGAIVGRRQRLPLTHPP
jgi:hypothetical protein